jgi:hypothetical protein
LPNFFVDAARDVALLAVDAGVFRGAEDFPAVLDDLDIAIPYNSADCIGCRPKCAMYMDPIGVTIL